MWTRLQTVHSFPRPAVLLALLGATLVLVGHVLAVTAAGATSEATAADPLDPWLGTLTHTVVLALLWLMVRTRFLFKVVPR